MSLKLHITNNVITHYKNNGFTYIVKKSKEQIEQFLSECNKLSIELFDSKANAGVINEFNDLTKYMNITSVVMKFIINNNYNCKHIFPVSVNKIKFVGYNEIDINNLLKMNTHLHITEFTYEPYKIRACKFDIFKIDSYLLKDVEIIHQYLLDDNFTYVKDDDDNTLLTLNDDYTKFTKLKEINYYSYKDKFDPKSLQYYEMLKKNDGHKFKLYDKCYFVKKNILPEGCVEKFYEMKKVFVDTEV